MKRYFNILSVIATASLLLASCSQLAPSKAEVEAGFSPLTPLPTLTIAGEPVCDPLNGIVTVPVTVDGLSANAGVLEVGIMTSTDPNFKSSKFKAVETPTSGTVNMEGAVTANTTYYIKAAAASPTGGTAYSNVVTVDVPDIPLYAKAPGTYSGAVVSDAYGDDYTSTIYIISDDEEPTKYVWIGGIEPYWAEDYPGKKFDYNYVLASVDEENGCLVVALGADLHLGGRMIAGLNSDHMSTATNYAPLTFAMTKSGDLYRANAFMTLKSNGDAEDCYAGGVTYKRK